MSSPKEEGCQKNGWCSKNFGPATTKHRTQSKQTWFKWIMYSQTAVRRMNYTPDQWRDCGSPKSRHYTQTLFFKRNAVLDKGPELQLVENESCICNKGRLAIPKPLQWRATIWYHHYLQHPGHTRLEETMKSAILYWKWMRNTIRFITKSCKSCQVNKKRTWKNRNIPSKIVISTPWEALCVDLVGPYTLNGKYGSSIDFMALTMINPTFSWFEVVELPTITQLMTRTVSGKEKVIEDEIFEISHLIESVD